MALPQGVLDFVFESADAEGVPRPSVNDDLFSNGVLDSFSLVNFVTLIEEQCGIKIPDNDVNPGNFQSLSAVERYVESHRN